MKEKKFLENIFNNFNFTNIELENLEELIELADKENDISVKKDCEKKIIILLNQIKKTEVSCFLSGENDHLDSYLEIHAGAGGTESQDWADMLRRMYSKWIEKKKCKFEIISEHKGEEAGIKSSIIKITGPYMYGWLKSESGVHRLVRISPFDSGARRHTSFASVWVYPVVDDSIKIEKDYAYGWLKRESGIHRLVRISPFDSNKRRHTSFASVWVYPEIDDKIEVEINESDLRIDTYRASGAGGQHVNTTDSAVRIKHIPTDIVVQCQSDRSQHKNKAYAMNMLKSRIYEFEMQKRKEKENVLYDQKKQIGWGNQIRSYVLHPYKLIKDLRTNHESSNINDVLDGEIDNFLEKSLSL